MKNNFEIIQDLLRSKAEYQARLNLIPYNGSVEIKEVSEKKYLYIRKRIVGKVSSTYVGPYSDELYQVLLKGVKEAKELIIKYSELFDDFEIIKGKMDNVFLNVTGKDIKEGI